jgi:FkbM family methyltransferase
MPNFTRIAAGSVAALLKTLIVRLPPGGRAWLAHQTVQDRFSLRSRALAGFCEQALHAWRNQQYDVERNGEAALLARLRPFAPRLLIDVGANVGDWSLAACQALPDAVVHAFEIAETTAATLIRNTAGYDSRIVINRLGLGETEGEITLYMLPQADTATSTLREVAALCVADQGLTEMVEIAAQITTGDAYLQRTGIRHVDLLKIDVEGAEFQVLAGFAGAFADGAIDIVQFEYGRLNLATRQFLGDFWRFFTDRGFVVGKLYPEGVAFKEYDLDDEDFMGPNYIACRSARTDIIQALRCPALKVA